MSLSRMFVVECDGEGCSSTVAARTQVGARGKAAKLNWSSTKVPNKPSVDLCPRHRR